MEKFSLQTEKAEYNAKKTEDGLWSMTIRYKSQYKDQLVEGEFMFPKNWGAIRVFQFIVDQNNVNAGN